MSLNIKDAETHRLVRELAALTGETQTEAVRRSVSERLDRQTRLEHGALAERLLTIGRDCASHLTEPWRSLDHGDLLYDDRGMPK